MTEDQVRLGMRVSDARDRWPDRVHGWIALPDASVDPNVEIADGAWLWVGFVSVRWDDDPHRTWWVDLAALREVK